MGSVNKVLGLKRQKFLMAIFIILIVILTIILSYPNKENNYFFAQKKIKLENLSVNRSYFCKTNQRIAFDNYLSKNGKYDYLKADTNLYEPDNSEMLILENMRLKARNITIESTRKKKYFFSMNLYNNEEALPFIIQEIMQLFKFLGPENIFLSIYENGSMDNTKLILAEFKKFLEASDLRYRLVADSIVRPEKYHRIEYLAGVRNKALEPLETEEKLGFVYDKIVFLNDIFFCYYDILELLYQSDFQKSDLTCPLDFLIKEKIPTITFRDLWVAHDLGGEAFNGNLNRLTNHKPSLERVKERLPFQVQCAWNGVAVINAAPFYGKDPIRFRRSDASAGECSASECSLLCTDFWKRGFRRIVVVPKILVPYSINEVWILEKNYELIMNTNQTLSEKISYVSGPSKVNCRGLEEYNRNGPDKPSIKVEYAGNDTFVI
ncbi:Alpha-1,3-mannosyltransferase CMT1 [Smittium culicis]|uniref:Alpha-1,3-mannosyltransferase CMT1 n=1 Tax=Smittium culicis TaxID=133412 RepID=A0A1R1XD53_9FUNG|nr:Alpha-1,3-mannosyltransferase CMT1 [Smittium culicis]